MRRKGSWSNRKEESTDQQRREIEIERKRGKLSTAF
jgi:hypothetical protein